MTSIRITPLRAAAALGSAATAALAALAAAPGAQAATYHAFLCRVPYGPAAGQIIPDEDNLTYELSGTFTFADSGCFDGVDGITAAIGGPAPSHKVGDFGKVTFTAPAATSISNFVLWRHEKVAASGSTTTPYPYTYAAYKPGPPALEGSVACAAAFGCTGRGNRSVPLDPSNRVAAGPLSGVSQIEWVAGCTGTAGQTCAAATDPSIAQYDVMAADIVLDDSTVPTPAPASGPLVAGGELTGVKQVAVRASDTGSGIARVQATLDGTLVADKVADARGGLCQDVGVTGDGRPSYRVAQPCPLVVDTSLDVDTQAVASGTHALVVSVVDAAGNRGTAFSGNVTTRRIVPPGSPNGVNATARASLTARFAKSAKKVLKVGFRRTTPIRGRLLNDARKPITGAELQILAREARAGARSKAIGSAITDAGGRFTARLPAGPSRAVTVRYVATTGATKAAATAKLRLSVPARLTVTAPRSVRGGGRLVVRGKLATLPRARVRVDLQALDRGRWRTIDDSRTRARGRFTLGSPISRGSRGRRFSFRVRVDSDIYPFARSYSRPFRVRVR